MIKELEKQSVRLQEIGSIKIGTKGEERKSQKGGTYRLPKKLDYFQITTKQRDAAGNFIPDRNIMNKIGERPTSLDIFLLYDDIDLNFDTSYVFYHGKKCICRGDGEMAQRRKKDNTIESIQCDRNTCEFAQTDDKGNRRCKAFGRLQCILNQSNVVGGVHVFRTTSWNTLQNIVSSLKLIQSLTGGYLAGIPLKMTLQPKTVTPEGMTTNTTVYTVNIVFPGSHQKLLEGTIEVANRRTVAGVKLREIQDQAKKLRASHFDESEADVTDIVQEFYPSAQEGADDFIEYVDPGEFNSVKSDNDEKQPDLSDDVPLPDEQDNSEQKTTKKNGKVQELFAEFDGEDGNEEDLLIDGVM